MPTGGAYGFVSTNLFLDGSKSIVLFKAVQFLPLHRLYSVPCIPTLWFVLHQLDRQHSPPCLAVLMAQKPCSTVTELSIVIAVPKCGKRNHHHQTSSNILAQPGTIEKLGITVRYVVSTVQYSREPVTVRPFMGRWQVLGVGSNHQLLGVR